MRSSGIEIFLAVLVAPLLGSFACLVADRLPIGRTVVSGRSTCVACGHVLGVRDLVPIFGWLLARGRCRYCAQSVNPLYPSTELLMLALAVWSFWVLPSWLAWVTIALGAVLITLAIIDWRHEILPDALTYPLIVAGLIVHWRIDTSGMAASAAAAFLGYVLVAMLRYAYQRVRRQEGVGLGDAKLLAAAGAWVSLDGLPGVVFIAAFVGLGWGLVRAIRGRSLELQTRIPFGPCLAPAFWITWLHGPLVVG